MSNFCTKHQKEMYPSKFEEGKFYHYVYDEAGNAYEKPVVAERYNALSYEHADGDNYKNCYDSKS